MSVTTLALHAFVVYKRSLPVAAPTYWSAASALRIALAVLFATAGCQSDTTPPDTTRDLGEPIDAARELFFRSGLGTLVSGVKSAPKIVVYAQYKRQLDDDAVNCLERAFSTAAAGALEDLSEHIIAALAEGDERDLHAALRFWRTSTADRISYERGTLSTPPGEMRMANALSRWRGDPPDANLHRRARDIVALSGQAKLYTRLSFDAVALLTAALKDKTPDLPDPEMATRIQFLNESQTRLEKRMLFVAERLDDEDSLALHQFWVSPAGRWLQKARHSAVTTALVDAAVRTRAAYASGKIPRNCGDMRRKSAH